MSTEASPEKGSAMDIGYFLSCEEYTPAELVEQAQLAEEAGFSSLWISDHFHPWNDAQGQSPLVWSMIGAIAQATDLPITTAVTCPTVRIHPAIIAQAAATSAVLTGGRFVLGVGSGEALNEHILGDAWPAADVRLEMLEEAVALIRLLWEGGAVTSYGNHYAVDDARIYTMPDTPPEIHVSGFGPKATELAARIGDGYISTMPDKELVQLFKEGSGGKPAGAGCKVAFAPTQDEGVEIAHRLWANAGLPGELAQVLYSPQHFEQASQLVTEDMIRESTVAGNELDAHLEQLRSYRDAGYDTVHVANMGPHYAEMIAFYGREVLPTFS
ncbi:MAG: TIGR03557 family F420-dependent LLM class oxidoreductase [Marmoricola sp.]